MPVIPVLKPRQVVKAFENLGWDIARQRGSHIIMTKQGELASLSIPNHPEVARGTLRGLIQKSRLTLDQFLRAL